MHSSGRFWLASVFVLFLAFALGGCDSSEDPALLNPTPPDSARVRVVNLIPDEQISVLVAGIPVATSLPSLGISGSRSFPKTDQVAVLVRRSRFDTLKGQNLANGSRITYFVVGGRDTTIIIPQSTSAFTEEDLQTRRVARLVFINALPDSAAHIVRIGCQGGDTLFAQSTLGGNQYREMDPVDASLYLAPASGGDPIATARVTLGSGGIYYLVAARVGGQPGLFLISPTSTTLAPAPAETRADAAVQVLNALPSGVVNASLGSQQIATGLQPLALAPVVDVNACGSNGGDTLQVTPAFGAPFSTMSRFSVGSRSTIVVYGTPDGVRTVTLRRDNPAGVAGKVYLRAINLVPTLPSASIEAGAGAPDSVQPEKRLFGLVSLGAVTGYQELPAGGYPLIVKDAASGSFLGGGVGTLAPGFYTLFIVINGESVSLMVSRDDTPTTTLADFGQRGAQVRLFNMMPDADAQFSAGGLSLPPLAYSYVRSTLFPAGLTTVTSNAGDVTIDLSSASYTIGATGSGGSHSLVAIPALGTLPATGRASVRFLNVVPGSGEMVIHTEGNKGAELARTSFGTPSAPIELDERKYAFAATSTSDTLTLAQANGLELTEGRHYLFIIGLKRPDQGEWPKYEVLWMQE